MSCVSPERIFVPLGTILSTLRMHVIEVYRKDGRSAEMEVTHCLGQSGRAEEEVTFEPGFIG